RSSIAAQVDLLAYARNLPPHRQIAASENRNIPSPEDKTKQGNAPHPDSNSNLGADFPRKFPCAAIAIALLIESLTHRAGWTTHEADRASIATNRARPTPQTQCRPAAFRPVTRWLRTLESEMAESAFRIP